MKRWRALALAAPIVAAATVAGTGLAGGDDERPIVRLESDAPTFASLDELAAASDLVVVATVAHVADRPDRDGSGRSGGRVPHPPLRAHGHPHAVRRRAASAGRRGARRAARRHAGHRGRDGTARRGRAGRVVPRRRRGAVTAVLRGGERAGPRHALDPSVSCGTSPRQTLGWRLQRGGEAVDFPRLAGRR